MGEHQETARRDRIAETGQQRPGVVGVGDEEQDRDREHPDGLIEVQRVPHVGVGQDAVRVAQVGLGHGRGVVGGQQCPGVSADHGVVVDVGHARVGVGVLGDLVHVVLCGQPGAQVEKLPHTVLGGQDAHCAAVRRERHANHLVSLSRGHSQAGHRHAALQQLLAAETRAAAEVRCRPAARVTITDLLRRVHPSPPLELRRLAERAGVTA